MRGRVVILVSIGLLLLATAYWGLEPGLMRLSMPEPAHTNRIVLPPRQEGLADVELWNESPPGEQGYWRARNAIRLVVIGGEAFLNDQFIPRGEIRIRLNRSVVQEKTNCVVVFAARGSKWGEILPVIDECRRSRVRVVFLNIRQA